MKHRKLLIGSIIAISIGIVLWLVVGPVIAASGVYTYQTGWWIFSQTHSGTTTAYWAGLTLAVIGLIIVIGGITGITISLLLEFLDRNTPATSADTQ